MRKHFFLNSSFFKARCEKQKVLLKLEFASESRAPKTNESQVPWPFPGAGKGRKANFSSLKICSYRNLLPDPGLPSSSGVREGHVLVTLTHAARRGPVLLTQSEAASRGWAASRICPEGRKGVESCVRMPRALVH